ncbi:MAG: hypothetical protein AAB367_00375 [Patescibacteria group bacterium]
MTPQGGRPKSYAWVIIIIMIVVLVAMGLLAWQFGLLTVMESLDEGNKNSSEGPHLVKSPDGFLPHHPGAFFTFTSPRAYSFVDMKRNGEWTFVNAPNLLPRFANIREPEVEKAFRERLGAYLDNGGMCDRSLLILGFNSRASLSTTETPPGEPPHSTLDSEMREWSDNALYRDAHIFKKLKTVAGEAAYQREKQIELRPQSKLGAKDCQVFCVYDNVGIFFENSDKTTYRTGDSSACYSAKVTESQLEEVRKDSNNLPSSVSEGVDQAITEMEDLIKSFQFFKKE